MADRLLSSSSVGYLVIPKLQDGKYEFGIGFPKDEWPLQKITVTVKNNDAGYILKNFDSKGWGLFNMQTMDVIMATSIGSSTDQNKNAQSDGFADALADVVSTPSIKQKPVADEVKETTTLKTASTEEKPLPVKEREIIKAAVKLFTTIDTSGRSIVYVDNYENKTDTIRIFIPYKTVDEIKETEKKVQPVESIKKEEPKPEVKKELKQENKQDAKFIDMDLSNPNAKVDSSKTEKKIVSTSEMPTDKKEANNVIKEITEPKAENKMLIITNSDCKVNASADDFLKLRKKMAAETTDDGMIAVAKKVFKSKCFSTEQISNLSSLFLKDEGRYNFFDVAYARVSDSQNFPSLVSKLSDEYYITRFKAMIRH